MLPYFRKSETRVLEPWNTTATFDERYHGRGGPLAVSDVLAPNTITTYVDVHSGGRSSSPPILITLWSRGRTFIAAAQSVGIPFNADLNGPDQLGVGHAQMTIGRPNLAPPPFSQAPLSSSALQKPADSIHCRMKITAVGVRPSLPSSSPRCGSGPTSPCSSARTPRAFCSTSIALAPSVIHFLFGCFAFYFVLFLKILVFMGRC